jgi:hypothetical protein
MNLLGEVRLTGLGALLIGVAALIAQRQSEAIVFDDPAPGAVFPPDMAAPEFVWRDPSGAREWRISIEFADGSAPHRRPPTER